jgi:hypothetical protein
LTFGTSTDEAHRPERFDRKKQLSLAETNFISEPAKTDPKGRFLFAFAEIQEHEFIDFCEGKPAEASLVSASSSEVGVELECGESGVGADGSEGGYILYNESSWDGRYTDTMSANAVAAKHPAKRPQKSQA